MVFGYFTVSWVRRIYISTIGTALIERDARVAMAEWTTPEPIAEVQKQAHGQKSKLQLIGFHPKNRKPTRPTK